jgi:hypothetical protein
VSSSVGMQAGRGNKRLQTARAIPRHLMQTFAKAQGTAHRAPYFLILSVRPQE